MQCFKAAISVKYPSANLTNTTDLKNRNIQIDDKKSHFHSWIRQFTVR